MANVTVTATNPAITVTKSNSVVNVASTTSTITVSSVAALANVDAVRAQFSSVDNGGDGSFSYSANTGIMTYTGPSQSEVLAHFSNVSPINLEANGQISVNETALFSGKTTDDLAEGSTNEYFTTARARQSISATAPLSYNSTSGVLSITEVGDISSVTAGSGLTGGGSSGDVTLNVGGGYGITVDPDVVSLNNTEVKGLFTVADYKDSGNIIPGGLQKTSGEFDTTDIITETITAYAGTRTYQTALGTTYTANLASLPAGNCAVYLSGNIVGGYPEVQGVVDDRTLSNSAVRGQADPILGKPIGILGPSVGGNAFVRQIITKGNVENVATVSPAYYLKNTSSDFQEQRAYFAIDGVNTGNISAMSFGTRTLTSANANVTYSSSGGSAGSIGSGEHGIWIGRVNNTLTGKDITTVFTENFSDVTLAGSNTSVFGSGASSVYKVVLQDSGGTWRYWAPGVSSTTWVTAGLGTINIDAPATANSSWLAYAVQPTPVFTDIGFYGPQQTADGGILGDQNVDGLTVNVNNVVGSNASTEIFKYSEDKYADPTEVTMTTGNVLYAAPTESGATKPMFPEQIGLIDIQSDSLTKKLAVGKVVTPSTFTHTGGTNDVTFNTDGKLQVNFLESITDLDVTASSTLTNAQVKTYIESNGLNATANIDTSSFFNGNILGNVTGSGTSTLGALTVDGNISSNVVSTVNYLKLKDDRITGTHNIDASTLSSQSDIHMLFDANNNAPNVTANYFKISHSSANTATATEVLRVDKAGDLYLTGNLEVTGNINYREVEDLLVQDQTITLNYGNASAQTSSIIVDRSGTGGGTNTAVRWNESTDKWQFSNDGSTYVDLIGSGDIPADAVTSVNGLTGVVVLDTDDVAEGTNKYYATSLFNTDLATKSTSDLAEGTNLYYTDGRFDTRLATKSTSDLSEGTNLYYTDARVDTHLSGGTGITYTSGSIDLDDTAVTPKTYGDASNIPVLTVDQQGRITAVSNVTVSGGGSYGNVEVTNFLQNGYGSNTITTTGNISSGNSIVENQIIGNNGQNNITTGLHIKSPTLGNFALNDNYIQLATESASGSFAGSNINALTNQYGLFKIGPDTNTGHIGSFWPGKSLLVDESLFVGKGLNFSRTALNINTRYSESYSHFVGTGAAASANAYINMAVGQTTGTPAGTVANASVGIKTHDGRGYILGWHDPIDTSVITYDNEPSWSSPGELNGWYAFGDLAKTTVNETFDANLTVTGNLIINGPTISSGDITTTGDITGDIITATDEFVGDLDGAVRKRVEAAEDLTKGDIVYISGGSGDVPQVQKAIASDASKMPAVGFVIDGSITTGSEGQIATFGLFSGIDTSAYTVGTVLYVDPTTAGAFTDDKPRTEANLIQKMGKVIKSGSGSSGKIFVVGAGRANAVSNLDEGNIFLGNAEGVAHTAHFTDEANTAIADYTGDMLEIGNIDVQHSLVVNDSAGTNTPALHVKAPGSGTVDDYIQLSNESVSGFGGGNITALQNNYGLFRIGPDTNTGYVEALGSYYPGKSLLVNESLFVGKGLNFSRTALNINTRYTPGYSHTLATTNPSANVYINMGVGDIGTGANPVSPAGAVANATVGIKTNKNLGSILGWHDPIDSSVVGYDDDPVFDPSTNINGWYSFKDLAKTTVDETFDANITVSGHTHLKAFSETKVDLGSQSGDLATLPALNASNASIFTVTATGGITLSSIPNATAGSSYTIIITQDGTGSHALTSTFLYAGGDKTLSTAGGSKDIISVVYDGSTYYASLTKAYA